MAPDIYLIELAGIPNDIVNRLIPEHARKQNLFMALNTWAMLCFLSSLSLIILLWSHINIWNISPGLPFKLLLILVVWGKSIVSSYNSLRNLLLLSFNGVCQAVSLSVSIIFYCFCSLLFQETNYPTVSIFNVSPDIQWALALSGGKCIMLYNPTFSYDIYRHDKSFVLKQVHVVLCFFSI